MTSLQELKRKNQLPPKTHRVWYYLRRWYKHRLDISSGEVFKLLTKLGLFDNNTKEWTVLGKFALAQVKEEIDHAASKQKRKRLRKR